VIVFKPLSNEIVFLNYRRRIDTYGSAKVGSTAVVLARKVREFESEIYNGPNL